MTKQFATIRRVGAAASLALLIACAQGQPQAAGDRAARAEADAPAVPTESVLGSYLAGQFAQREHNYAAAADYLDRALEKDPGNLDLLRRTFLLRLSEGDMVQVNALAQRLSSADPRSGLPALVLVVEQVKAGNDADAAAAAARLPDDGLLRFAAPLAIAWTNAGQHNLKGATLALDRLDKMRGFETLKAFHLALIDDFLGDQAAAERAYKKMVDTPDRLNWRALDMAGNFYERRQRIGDAKALYERFAQENPDSRTLVEPALARIAAGQPPPPRVQSIKDGLAEALFDVASVLNQRDTQDLALLYARLALELEPNLPLARMLIAEIAESQDRLEEGLALYRSVDPASPFSWTARLRIAEVLDALDRTDEATTELKAMAAERPDSPQPLIEWGDILRGRSRYADAVGAYDGAVARINPSESRHWGIFYSRGIALERSGQWPRAEADFLHALELQPEQPLVLNYLGYSWVEKGQNLQRALKMIERAVELRPNDGYIVDSLGWAFYQIGKYPEAAQYLERAIELLPQDPTINDHLGDAYWQTGRQAEARYQWHRALQFSPEADLAKTIEAKLDTGIVKPGSAALRGG